MVSNENDKVRLREILLTYREGTTLASALDDLLTTIRKEEREAAFLEAADYIRRQWLAAYPVEVFPEPPKPPAECSRDRISAAMGRHMAMKLIEHFEAAASTKEENES